MTMSAAPPLVGFLLAIFLCDANAKSGYLLSVPESLDAGSEQHLLFQLNGVKSDGRIAVRLLRQHSGYVLSDASSFVSAKDVTSTIRLKVPDMGTEMAQLEFNGTFGGNYRFYAKKDVQVNKIIKQKHIFVETDKPIYKPGQKVKFRVLPIDSDLKPLGNTVSGDIWINTPTEVRVAQWKSVSFAAGMVQYEMDLTDDPPLGNWTIYVQIPTLSGSRKFSVQKYVLPKFDVTITPPPYFLANETIATYKICGKYTYGKPINGFIKVEASYKQESWEHPKLTKSVTGGRIKGCYNYTLDTRGLAVSSSYSNSNLKQKEIIVTAHVTEDGTDVNRSATYTLKRTFSPFNMSFKTSQEGRQHFRPGLPYLGLIKVEKPDSKPAPSETINICLKIKRERWNFKNANNQKMGSDEARVCKNYVSDQNGEVHFTIPPQPQDAIQIDIKAVAAKFAVTGCSQYGYSSSDLTVAEITSVLHSWFSPSGSQIYIEPALTTIPCNMPHSISFQYTTDDHQDTIFTYLIISHGSMVLSGEVENVFSAEEDASHYRDSTYITNDDFRRLCRGQNTTEWENVVIGPAYVGKVSFDITPNYAMSTQAKLVVYYIRKDGEVVADWTDLKIKRCLKNQVNLQFRKKQQYPGSNAAMKLSASPSSLCGIGIVDQSVNLLAANNRIQLGKVFDLINANVRSTSHRQQVTPSNQYCARKYHYNSCGRTATVSEYSDSITAFEKSGVLVISDLTLEVRPCKFSRLSGNDAPVRVHQPRGSRTMTLKSSEEIIPQSAKMHYITDTVSMPKLQGAVGLSFTTAHAKTAGSITVKAATTHTEETATTHTEETATSGSQGTTASGFTVLHSQPVLEIRNYFPETWLWDLEVVGPSGTVNMTRELPHTVTEWVGNAVCISKNAGLGVSETASITAFQPFFVSSSLPYSVIRGETVPITISVFSYLKTCLPITLTLEKSSSFQLVDGSHEVNLCVCDGESVTFKYMVKPLIIGKINATVYAYSNHDESVSMCDTETEVDDIKARDAATWKLLVESEGFPQTSTSNMFFCTGSNLTFQTQLSLRMPTNVVPGSARAYITVTGDLMGPALKDLGNLLPLPTGCGEQTLSKFAPQIFILDYLTSSHLLTKNIKDKALANLKEGYVRELTFQLWDGSYAMYPNQQTSIWLTAAVIRYFGQMRRHVSVDENNVQRSVNWILGQQQGNGCFLRLGSVPYSALGGSQSPGALTAYILISLMESGFGSEHLWNRGKKCLEDNPSSLDYTLALYAYAAVLAKSPLAATFLQRLEQLATKEDGMQYWKVNASTSASLRVETASYVALAYMKSGSDSDIAKVVPIIRWLAKSMNPQGGFLSTQDTLVAIQAIAVFSMRTHVDPSGLAVTVTGRKFRGDYNITADNQLVVQSRTLRCARGTLNVTATGKGCAFVQAALYYNIIVPDKYQHGFYITVTSTRGFAGSCKRAAIHICANFEREDPSNMVIIELKLLSGFEADTDTLDALLMKYEVGLKKYEVKDGKVILYFDEMTSKKICFDITVTENQEVLNLKPATVKIYDYYDQGRSVSESYTLGSNCSLSSPGSSRVNVVVYPSDNRVKPFQNRDRYTRPIVVKQPSNTVIKKSRTVISNYNDVENNDLPWNAQNNNDVRVTKTRAKKVKTVSSVNDNA